MKTHRFTSSGVALVGLALALFSAPASRGGVLSFLVDINTASISGLNPSGPFYLDLQLTHDSGLTNTVTASNFFFTGGLPFGFANSTGGASGDLSSSVSLTDAAFLNELFQQFTPGTTDIHFQVDMTTNTPGSTPDGFSISILDNNTNNIPTSAPGSDTLVQASITSGLTLSGIATYASNASPTAGVTASITAIPEPSTTAVLFGFAAAAVCGLRRRMRRQTHGA